MTRAGRDYLKGWVLGLCVCCLPFWGLGQAIGSDVLRLSEGDSLFKTGRYDFHPYLYVFFDSLPNRPIEEVVAPDFQQHFAKDSLHITKAYQGDRNQGINGLWGRLTLYPEYERDQEWLISFNAGYFDLYLPGDSGQYAHRREGFGVPILDSLKPFLLLPRRGWSFI